jgi:hypothetical protein
LFDAGSKLLRIDPDMKLHTHITKDPLFFELNFYILKPNSHKEGEGHPPNWGRLDKEAQQFLWSFR